MNGTVFMAAIFASGSLLVPATAAHAGRDVQPKVFPTIEAMDAVSPVDVWAVGEEYGFPAAEHWDGRAWHQVTVPQADGAWLAGVSAVSTNDVWAVGFSADVTTHRLHWDGTSWSEFTGPERAAKGELVGVASVSSDDVWAVGYRSTSVETYRSLVEHWNGQRWEISPTPTLVRHAYRSTLESVSFAAPDDGWAIGYATYGDQGEFAKSAALHWDGTSWTRVALPDPLQQQFFPSLSASTSSNVWMSGLDAQAGPATARWDGVQWRPVAFPQVANSRLHSIVAISEDDVWVAGEYVAGEHPYVTLPLVGHWDGSTWQLVELPGGKAHRTSISSTTATGPDDVWIGGQSGSKMFFRHWDGSSWS